MKHNTPGWLGLVLALFLFSCADKSKEAQKNAQRFIDEYTATYLDLYYKSSLAEWASNTRIIDGDTSNAWNTKVANEAFAAFTGDSKNLDQARTLLAQKEWLSPLQVRQLEAILYAGANYPGTEPDLVKARIAAETDQNQKLFGFDFTIGGRSVSANDLDQILSSETQLERRLQAWQASKEVGRDLKPGLEQLRNLRNQSVQALGYPDYFSYQVSDYGMSRDEMMELNRQLIQEIWPLYRELHTWARYELAKKYKQSVPELLPAHWLQNRWGQDWSDMVQVKGIDLDKVLREKGAEWLVKQSERFYVSLGFDTLPASFYQLSDLYPAAPDAGYKKNNHASAWHMDLQHDVRSLMSVIPNAKWYETTHHELGHIYYYLSYTNPDVPPLLRGGANRAFHEGVGSLMGLAAMQKPFLAHLGLIQPEQKTDEMQSLLKEALNYVVFIPWSAGTMTHFEHDLYADSLPVDQFNKRWWWYAEQFQGITPPGTRGEEYCDASSKTHINNDPAQYYDYALSFVILFQLHDHIARTILNQDPRMTNYYGSKETGKFLHSLLYPGASVDWRELLEKNLGTGISAEPMLRYFEPLMDWLKKENAGRKYSLPDTPIAL